MPLIISPRQLNQRAEFYLQLGTLLSAGMTLIQSLEHLRQNAPARSYRQPIGRLLECLQQGETVSDAFGELGTWIPSFDGALIEAGERSGRLDACFKLLGFYYRERAQMLRQMISDLLYPAVVFHFAVVLFPFLDYVKSGNLARFILTILGVLAPVYGAVFLVIYACQGRHGQMWRGWIERLLHHVPMLGVARRQLALARLAAALEALLNAGVPVIHAWELAAAASGSPALAKQVHSWKESLEAGATPSELIASSREFPDLFSSLYRTGEISGTLDDSLKRLEVLYREEGSRKLHAAALWTPRLLYLGVVLLVAWKVISFYASYFNQIGRVMDMR